MKIGLLCGREYSFPPAFIDRVNAIGRDHGITAEFVTLAGTKMGEPSEYRVIVDRISHEVEYYRAFLKHAVLEGTYVINNPFWWTADDKFFNYAVAQRIGVAIPKTVVLPQKSYPAGIDLTAESLRNLGYPIDWDGLLDYVGRPAILKPFSGGGWKHVYKVHNKEELLAAYDVTGALLHDAAAVHQLRSVRALLHLRQDRHHAGALRRRTSGKYLVEHDYLPSELGARIVKDAQTLNTGARLRDEHDRVRDPGRRALRDRLPQPGARLRARSHHAALLRHGARQDVEPGHRPRAERPRAAVVAALGADGRPVGPASPAAGVTRSRLSGVAIA